MKYFLTLFFPIFFFGQQKDDWAVFMQKAMKDIQNNDFKAAIVSLDKSLKAFPENPSALYFKGYSQIIIGEKEEGCKSLVDAIYYESNSAKVLFPEKCIDYNPKLDPKNFKTGKFTWQVLGYSTLYNFERKNNMQIETFEGKTYTGKIIWHDNGEYAIIPTAETEAKMEENPKFLIRILKIAEESYLYERIEEAQIQYGIVKKIE